MPYSQTILAADAGEFLSFLSTHLRLSPSCHSIGFKLFVNHSLIDSQFNLNPFVVYNVSLCEWGLSQSQCMIPSFFKQNYMTNILIKKEKNMIKDC